MKRFFVTSLSIVLLTFAAQANPFENEKEVVVGVNNALFAGPFNSQVDVKGVTSGLFPNGCYRWNRFDVYHQSETVHDVRAIASVTQGMCIMVLVPFSKQVNLGKLSPGTHTVRFHNGDDTFMERKLTVHP